MATTTVSDAVVVPQAQGTGLASEDDPVDAAAAALLAAYPGRECHTTTLTSDPTNDEVDVSGGIAYILDTSTSTANSRGAGGNAQVQSTSSSGYDTEIPEDQVYCVILPTANNGLSGSVDTADQDVYLSLDPTAQNSVTLHHNATAPSEPHVYLGSFDTTSGGTATQATRLGGPSSEVHLETQTASGDATIAHTTSLIEAFDHLVVDVSDVQPDTNDVGMEMQFSEDGGATWQTGATDYEYTGHSQTGSHINTAAKDDSHLQVLRQLDNAASTSNGRAELNITGHNSDTVHTLVEWGAAFINGGPTIEHGSFAGRYQSATPVNAIRFQMSSGNIASGTFALYGVVQ